ncbi:MFS transporter [Litoribacter alkaliphilus]|uniref:MFS transporter n=1 Tax=Litoribacter ruber TaxID=702568 RepID=A0AAP2G5D1_9BACT|nr:MFS transporter [Litoribacter alkaliphilus]MBS9524393.1 MFS transporter [Litoribacter alkaliphilus]
MKHILPIIVLSQFLCTSLWFAGNAVLPDLIAEHGLPIDFLAHLTSAVQFGFITGTLIFAILTVADRFSPSKVFFFSSLLAAGFNWAIGLENLQDWELLLYRFLTGVFLAGIYPVGMKIAADYYDKGLGKSLGFLVGALVLGTAFPHFLKSMTGPLPWHYVVYSTTFLAMLGGLLILVFVPDGPYRKAGQQFDPAVFLNVFKNANVRSAAFGYFGHMWELYAFWAFLPLLLAYFNASHDSMNLDVPFFSFLIIAVGGISCALGGLLSLRFGAKRIATASLAISGLCCIFSPLILAGESTGLLILFLLIWGMAVTADSPLFSTLVVQNAPQETRGTALTIVNCIGFALTIVSIQVLNFMLPIMGEKLLFTALAMGPLLGVISLRRKI